MNAPRPSALTGLALAGVLALSACGSDNGAGGAKAAGSGGCASGSLSGAGSTFQQNIEQQWISDFGARCSGAQVNYQGTGSGAGIEQFGAGTIDFAGSDVTMKPEEQAKADARCKSKAIALPVTAGGIAVIYHLSGVEGLKLSAKNLAGIFTGTIKKWNDPAIAADNSGVALPDKAITPYHRADGSGTTAVFSAFLDAAAKGTWTLGTGKELQWPAGAGQAAKGSDGVTAGVKATDGGVTYAEVSFAKANSLPTALVAGSSGEFVPLTGDGVSKAIESGFAVTGSGGDVSGKIDFSKVSGYPISTVSYAIVCQKYADGAKAKLVKAYFGYVLSGGQSGADQLGFAPLPGALTEKSKTAAQAVS